MFEIDRDKTIHLTRGDIATIEITASDENGEVYTFQKTDVVRFKVLERKNCNAIVMCKDIVANDITEKVLLKLSSEDTKIDEVINKPVDYWYEVELNPDTEPQTIIGYDKDGAKIFRLYPEGSEIK